MKYYIKTFGCQMNEHDSEIIAGILESAGYQPAEDLAAADVIPIQYPNAVPVFSINQQ